MADWASRVTSWTNEATPHAVEKTPRAMNVSEVAFLTDMVKTELFELARTVMTIDEAYELVYKKAPRAADMQMMSKYEKPTGDKLILEQADALVDWTVYTLNAAAKMRWNLNPVFNEVMLANEAKRWPDGTYHRRDDGKIIKPDNWQEPNLDRALPGLLSKI
jgi:predicted HAD superfamily Cof-like phosphohydrolase